MRLLLLLLAHSNRAFFNWVSIHCEERIWTNLIKNYSNNVDGATNGLEVVEKKVINSYNGASEKHTKLQWSKGQFLFISAEEVVKSLWRILIRASWNESDKLWFKLWVRKTADLSNFLTSFELSSNRSRTQCSGFWAPCNIFTSIHRLQLYASCKTEFPQIRRWMNWIDVSGTNSLNLLCYASVSVCVLLSKV